jgi:beta-N-acetylhexosaminidase
LNAGQIALVGLEGPTLGPREAALLRRHEVAGVVLFRRNVRDASQLRELCDSIHAALLPVHDSLPPLIAADHEGGHVTALGSAIGIPPSPLCLGIADDLELTRHVHRETARRARAVGVSFLLAPVADVVATDNPVISTRAFGTEPGAVRRHVSAALTGLREGGVVSCAKHWPGHGSPRVDSHFDIPTVETGSEGWAGHDLPPFLPAIEGGSDAIMAGHLRVPALDSSGVVATVSEPILREWLRRRLGFEGLIITDALEMGAFRDQRPVDALRAGCDLLLFAAPVEAVSESLTELDRAVESGPSRARLAEAQARVADLRRVASDRGDSGGALGAWTEDPPAYEEARRRGAVALGFAARDASWPPAPSPVRWGLVDAASGDRLVRAPRPGENPFERDPGPPEGTGRYLEPLAACLGPPATPPIVLPPEAAEDAAADLQGRLQAATEALGRIEGWVVASVRPLARPVREALAGRLLVARPRWVALLGDLSLQAALPSDVSLILVPGATPADVEILAGALTGALPIAVQGRWGD